jgi:hypothetical protein
LLPWFWQTAASIAWGFASRRFDSPGKNWLPPAILGSALLLGQLLLLFIESKEECELADFRRRRDKILAQSAAAKPHATL